MQNIFIFKLFTALFISPILLAQVQRPPIGQLGELEEGSSINIQLVGRFQNYNEKVENSRDVYDTEIYSPKSVKFHPNNHKVYVNSLEGFKTIVYSLDKGEWAPRKIKSIYHKFGKTTLPLFQDLTTVFNYPFYSESPGKNPNFFKGKPVEMAFSHAGRYLWVTYYRRDYDSYAQSPSAVAVIDTNTDEIVRVIPTGPIPKIVVVSEEKGLAAIVHWGDNTVGVLDISSDNPNEFQYIYHLMKNRPMSQEGLEGTNRDRTCGFCLRGASFLPQSNLLLVGEMRGGDILGFDIEDGKYLGSFEGVPATVRHMDVARKRDELIISSNYLGFVSMFSIPRILSFFNMLKAPHGVMEPDKTLSLGRGARTVAISPSEDIAVLALNNKSQLVTVDLESFTILNRVMVNSYPVGLGFSPSGKYVWSTSQGKSGKGGNSVNIFELFNIESESLVLR
ncbi:MAG: hypothetical protein HOO06_01215 [Bdellovibrionaceae bacterium]|nr:hypothetical protein [Pseudobdellovibrionaceae bacterium]